MKKGVKYKKPPMRFDVALQKYVPDLAAIKRLKLKSKKQRR